MSLSVNVQLAQKETVLIFHFGFYTDNLGKCHPFDNSHVASLHLLISDDMLVNGFIVIVKKLPSHQNLNDFRILNLSSHAYRSKFRLKRLDVSNMVF